jgi:hypothetical protein
MMVLQLIRTRPLVDKMMVHTEKALINHKLSLNLKDK